MSIGSYFTKQPAGDMRCTFVMQSGPMVTAVNGISVNPSRSFAGHLSLIDEVVALLKLKMISLR